MTPTQRSVRDFLANAMVDGIYTVTKGEKVAAGYIAEDDDSNVGFYRIEVDLSGLGYRCTFQYYDMEGEGMAVNAIGAVLKAIEDGQTRFEEEE